MTYANVASTLALLLVVGGGGVAVAAGAIPRNSVASRHIVNNAVKSIDVRNDTLKGADINESLLGQVPDAAHADNATNADNASSANTVSNGAITGPKITPGPIGVVRGYAWNNLLSTSGTLTNGYTYNETGGAVTSTHNATGSYTVSFAGLNIGTGNVQVSAYGGGATSCKVGSWGSSAANVLCFDAAGNPANSLFSLAMIE
jgi:hypothetical protein